MTSGYVAYGIQWDTTASVYIYTSTDGVTWTGEGNSGSQKCMAHDTSGAVNGNVLSIDCQSQNGYSTSEFMQCTWPCSSWGTCSSGSALSGN